MNFKLLSSLSAVLVLGVCADDIVGAGG